VRCYTGHYATVKYSSQGEQVWARHYGNSLETGELLWGGASALVLDASGNIYVTGGLLSEYSSQGFWWCAADYATVKYDPDGNELWVAPYDGSAGRNDWAKALAVDDAGNVYVTGHWWEGPSYAGGPADDDYATIKYRQCAGDSCSSSFSFLRGDCDADGVVGGSVNDPLFYLNWAFGGGPTPPCKAACDCDADGVVAGITDAVYYLNWAFIGGPPPPAPYPDCGPGTAADQDLGCETPPAACLPPP
jgi:hypothetical protein